MDKPVVYRLTDPSYTIYHRAALGGLAATIHAWGDHGPADISTELKPDRITLSWPAEISDANAVTRILQASFQVSKENLINLPGQGIEPNADDLKVAIHNALCMTFLQHNKMRPAPPDKKTAIQVVLRDVDDDEANIISYKAVKQFAHQTAQSTGLFKKGGEPFLSESGAIQQWCVPGALGGAQDLEVPAKEILLLSFLIVACPVFILRSRRREEKAQYGVVVPDVVDLKYFARALHKLAARGAQAISRINTLRGRVAGGAEEAALRFLIDLKIQTDVAHRSVAGCLAITMGRVAWDKNQVNRSSSIRIRADYPEIAIFEAANQYLTGTRLIKLKTGEAFPVPKSPIPELVAANLAENLHWCSDFKLLVAEKKDFQQMYFWRKGLIKMKQAIKDIEDQQFVGVFQEAWRWKIRSLYERAKNETLDPERLIEVERERMRNEILRAKASELLASWFLRFCADATRGATLPSLRDNSSQVRRFIFNQRNSDRFQNLCLFALLSYEGKESINPTNGGK